MTRRKLKPGPPWWYRIYQDALMVAGGEGSILEDVRRDMLHYALVYSQDGAIQIQTNIPADQ